MRIPSAVPMAAIAGLLLLPFASCNNDETSPVSAGPMDVAGYAQIPPSMEGSWVIKSTRTGGTCGFPREFFNTDPLELHVTQVGNDLVFDQRDGCGRALLAGTGTVTPAGIVTLSSETFEPLTTSCTLKLSQVRNGTAGTPPNTIAGSDVLNISGGPACAGGVPCSVNGTFTATRCPAAGCGLACR
jgi:hypothetical protein